MIKNVMIFYLMIILILKYVNVQLMSFCHITGELNFIFREKNNNKKNGRGIIVEDAINAIIFKGIYDGKKVYIKMFGSKIPRQIENFLYEQKIYNYLQTKDDSIKAIFNDYFIESIDTFVIDDMEVVKNILPRVINKHDLENTDTYRILDTCFECYFIITLDYELETLYNYLIKPDLSENDFIEIIFELLYMVYLMNIRLKIRHNDLHFSNIMIKKLDYENMQEYKINDKKYRKIKKFKVCVYDYDLSYSEKIGDNKYIEENFSHIGFKNTINNAKDIWTVVRSLYKDILLNSTRPINNIIEQTINLILKTNNMNISNTPQTMLFNFQRYNRIRYFAEFCNEPKEPCIEPILPDLHPDQVIERYIFYIWSYYRIIRIYTLFTKIFKI